MSKTSADGLSQPQMILLAAAELELAGKVPFTVADLTVFAWRSHPKVFGLSGYEDKYPCSNKVNSSIVGEHHLASLGYLVKVGPKQYLLTASGRAIVQRALGQTPEEVEAVGLTGADIRLLDYLVGSMAVTKFDAGHRSQISFADASVFWSFTGVPGKAVDAKISMVGKQLQDIANLLPMEDDQAGLVRKLLNIHKWLVEHFQKHLHLLRTR